jgi:alpha-1,3-rhamnosyltransferase
LIEKNEKAGITSVLMPLYNHASTVERSLNSMLLSDCSKIELIICDDASHDQSFEIASLWIEKCRNKFESIHAVKNSINLGITKNFNKLMSLAAGEFVTFCASDDEFAPEGVDKLRLYISNNPHLDFVYANCSYINQQSQLINEKIISNWRARLIRSQNCALVDLVYNWGVVWSRLFARRAAFNRIGPYPEQLSFEDRWGALKIAQTKRYGYMHEIVFLYRLRDSGTGSAGLNPEIIFKDMVDIERMSFRESSGLLKILLFVRVKAQVDLNSPNKIRLHWVMLRKFIRLVHYTLILGK